MQNRLTKKSILRENGYFVDNPTVERCAKAIDKLGELEDAEEREQTAATNEELIKTMCTDDFNKFLFRFKVNAVANFLESGGVNIMDAVQQKEWLQSENKEFLFKLMRDEEE